MPPNAKSIADSSSLTNATAKANASASNDTFYPTFEAHTTDVNENNLHEVAKTFHVKEFGNGSANGGTGATYADATMLTSSADDIAYVMDDGLTSLSVDNAYNNGDASVGIFGANNFKYYTFIGTGFAIKQSRTSSTPNENHTITVDGVEVKTNHIFSGTNFVQIAQNLPYGTHVVKILKTNHSIMAHFTDVSFYQPKRPPIPEDACILADYMLMADYVANTSGSLSNISKGVRMISSSRDVFYDATSTTDLAYNHANELGIRNRGPRVRWGNIGNGGTDGPIITYFGHPNVDYHIGTSTDGSERYHLKLTNSSGTLETTNVSGTTSSGSISNHEITGVSTSSGSAYFSSSKSDGVLGANKGELIAYPDDATYDWLYLGDVYVATPIHTSSHYQTFETPFLHELVGGDRNMEQHNLVCSPDGKTWDEVTRDVSYLSQTKVSCQIDHDSGSGNIIFDEWRGVNDAGLNAFNKNFAIAYDRLICLEEGMYQLNVIFSANGSGSAMGVSIYVNGNQTIAQFADHESSERSSVAYSAVLTLNKNDYVQVNNSGTVEGTDPQYNQFSISKL